MAPSTVAAARAIEAQQMHLAACRYRAQGLVCSTCTELTERAVRLMGQECDSLTVRDGVVHWSRVAA